MAKTEQGRRDTYGASQIIVSRNILAVQASLQSRLDQLHTPSGLQVCPVPQENLSPRAV
jgi:hypothetical protein